MILVTGATGNIGRHVVTGLLNQGERVRALTLDSSEEAALPNGVEVVTGDMADPQVLATALRDVRRVFLFPVFDVFSQVLAGCVAADVEQVVLLSSAVVTFPEPGWLGREQARLETEVRESGLGWARGSFPVTALSSARASWSRPGRESLPAQHDARAPPLRLGAKTRMIGELRDVLASRAATKPTPGSGHTS
ncbi:SDR family oxidoreductase [Nonomuraea angiospora]|uniref:NmrA-like domain-containing protein n=1 Tax=Nonomuraea angiospora TaxID=46172 RepID=A0ABR9M231_9ACTN|nr:NAD(P)H-binding protein [Nonomuraea angiospora]MBE1586968.1 hypothetical protein [Nonomuraea angiospora]